MTPAIIIDTETTDSDPSTAEIVEIAYATFEFGKPQGMATWARFGHFNPMRWGAVAAHGILPSEVLDIPPYSSEHCPSAHYWIGHNVDFDWEVCGRPAVYRICTLAMARAIWPECDSHTLSALTYFTQGARESTRDKVRRAHGAVADIGLCADLLSAILFKTNLTTLEDLYAFSEDARIPRVMSFGKFKGEPISSVDRGYANWYRRQPDPDQYLLEAFRRQGLI